MGNTSSSKSTSTSTSSARQIPTSTTPTTLPGANNEFGLELFRNTCDFENQTETKSNVLVSPLSIGAAMTMTALGCSNDALTAITDALRIGRIGGEDEAMKAWHKVIEMSRDKEIGVELTIANSVWSRHANAVLEDFIAKLRQHFEAEVMPLSGAAEINSWCSTNTKGLITNIIDEVPADVILYLINAVYFKGKWINEFNKGDTLPWEFRGLNKKVDMMYMKREDWQYAETSVKGKQVQMVNLGYKGDQVAMTVILPEADTDIDKVIAGIDGEWWSEQHSRLGATSAKGTLRLPRLKLSYGVVDLGTSSLMKQGLTPLFTATHGLERMFDYEKLRELGVDGVKVSRVLHKVVVELDEEGTVAAAITAVECSVECLRMDSEPEFCMTCDRPFVFVIGDLSTGLIFFVGKVVNPQADA